MKNTDGQNHDPHNYWHHFGNFNLRNYQAIEAGEVNPRLPKLIELADYFGVSVDYLLGRTENREINR